MLVDGLAAQAAHGFVTAAHSLCRFEESLGWLVRLESTMKSDRIAWRPQLEPSITLSLAGTYASLGRFEEALPYAERAVPLHKERGHTVEAVKAMCTLSSVYAHLEQFDKGLPMAKQTYNEAKKSLGSSHPITKHVKSSLEIMKSMVKDPQQAKRKMAACRQKRAAAKLSGLSEQPELNGTRVEIQLYDVRKEKYSVSSKHVADHECPGVLDQGESFFVSPKHAIFESATEVYLHSLKQTKHLNGKEGLVRYFCPRNGRFVVQVGNSKNTVNIKPENLLAKHQARVVDPNYVSGIAQKLTAANR